MQGNLATQMAPPFVLVAHYFIAGAFFYALSALILPFYANDIGGFFLTNDLAALLHVYLLGFVMMVIFGAMYQLIPVLLEVPLFSKDFAYVQFYMYAIGICLFCFGLAYEFQIVPYGALLIYASMLVFIVNLFLSYLNLKDWNFVAITLLVANLFLFLGASLGFVISLDLIYGFWGDILLSVRLHVSATIGGFVLLVIMGVGKVLIPMFALSHDVNDKAIKAGVGFLGLGLLAYMMSPWLTWIGKIVPFGLMFLGVLAALWQMLLYFRKRVRKQNDFWAKNMIASFISALFSMIVLVFALVNGSDKMVILFGFIFLFGFLIYFIVGHIYKILPFLVWYQRFSPLVGKQKVPMLHDMIDTKIADWQFWITSIGLILGAVAIGVGHKLLFQIGSLVMAIGTLLVMYNILFTLMYKIKEQK